MRLCVKTMRERHYLDGKPYYCDLCGLGFGEFMACEEPDCKLESEDKAKKRAEANAKGKVRRASTRTKD